MIETYDAMASGLVAGTIVGAVGWVAWGTYRGWVYDEREKGNKVGVTMLVRRNRGKDEGERK